MPEKRTRGSERVAKKKQPSKSVLFLWLQSINQSTKSSISSSSPEEKFSEKTNTSNTYLAQTPLVSPSVLFLLYPLYSVYCLYRTPCTQGTVLSLTIPQRAWLLSLDKFTTRFDRFDMHLDEQRVEKQY